MGNHGGGGGGGGSQNEGILVALVDSDNGLFSAKPFSEPVLEYYQLDS